LAEPSQNNPVAYYSRANPNIYDRVINKYMSPDGSSDHSHGMDM
jgi:hypothetical protein